MKSSIFKKAFLAFSLSLLSILLSAQDIRVKGTVVDENGDPMVGAGIVQKGTANGVVSDIDGTFRITVPKDAVLVFSSVNFQTQEIPATATMHVTMVEDRELLDEVIVIGYGTTRAKNFTGSVDVVKMEDSPVADLGLSNVSNMLRGMLTGVNIGAESNRAGSSSSILIRGRKSISGGDSPLLVLDGIIYDGSLDSINPAIIESVSVLKDATSLAAYGSRAANGVIMVTTKQGKEGRPMVNFMVSQEFQTPSYTPQTLSPEDYIKYRNVRIGKTDYTDTGFMSFLEKANYEKGRTYDWVDLATRTGSVQNYNLSVSGRNDRTNYYFALGRSQQKGMIRGDEFWRNNFSARISSRITDWLEIGTNVSYDASRNDSNTASISTEASPYMEPYLPDGKTLRFYIEGVNATTTNPLWNLEHGADRLSKSGNLNLGGNITVKFPFVKGLSYKFNVKYRRSNSKSYSFTHEWNATPALLSNDWEGEGQTSKYWDLANASGSTSNSLSESYVLDNILSYDRQFGRHYVSGSLVYTRDSAESSGDSMSGTGFTNAGNTIKGWYGLGDADTKTVGSPSYSLHTDVGYLARIIYSYADKYHLNASIRRDGSSVFGADRKWGNFPAVGAAWTISRENFFRGVHWVDMLKLKASWGKNGAQTLAPYGTLSTISVAKSGGIANYYDGEIHWGQKISALGNPQLGWQTTTSFNGGVEGDLFKGRLHFDINLYKSSTTDQIFSRNIPIMTAGIGSQQATMGQVDNKGVEINLSGEIIRRSKLKWNSQVAFTLNRNKLVDLYGDGEDDVANSRFLGEPLSVIYGYRTEGIFQEGQYEGYPIFYTADGEQTATPGADARAILGYGDENFRLSWANTFTYGDFQLYFMFQGIFGGGGYGLADNTFAYTTYSTTEACTALNIPFYTHDNPSNVYPAPNVRVQQYAVYNSYGHVRLQNLSLSYNMRPLAKALNIPAARLTLSGRNLFCIAPHWKMSDPQDRSGSSIGLPRAFTLGLNVTL